MTCPHIVNSRWVDWCCIASLSERPIFLRSSFASLTFATSCIVSHVALWLGTHYDITSVELQDMWQNNSFRRQRSPPKSLSSLLQGNCSATTSRARSQYFANSPSSASADSQTSISLNRKDNYCLFTSKDISPTVKHWCRFTTSPAIGRN